MVEATVLVVVLEVASYFAVALRDAIRDRWAARASSVPPNVDREREARE